MDSRNLVTSIVTCSMPEAYGRAEYPLFTRICGTFVLEGEIQSKFEYLNLIQPFCYLDIDWRSLYALWAAEDPIVPALADVDLNPISWSTYWSTLSTMYGRHTPPDDIVVWSLHA